MNPEVSSTVVALIQMSCERSTMQNLEKAESQIVEAAKRGARVICLQELFASQYPCQIEDETQFDHAESIPGPSTAFVSALVKKLDVVCIAPIFERRAAGVFHNSAVAIESDGSIVGSYRKMHLPDASRYREKFFFSPGDLGFPTFKTSQGVIGVGICWDQWFPESARLLALAGAQMIFYPSAIGWRHDEPVDQRENQLEAWKVMMRSHSIANKFSSLRLIELEPKEKSNSGALLLPATQTVALSRKAATKQIRSCSRSAIYFKSKQQETLGLF